MKPIIVLAGIIRYKNKILISKRYLRESNDYKWEFPGGKLEKNEELKHCLEREIKEELNLHITVGEIFEVVYHRYSDISILLLTYLCDSTTDKATAVECMGYKWISLNELELYDFLDADKFVIDKILRYKEKIFQE